MDIKIPERDVYALNRKLIDIRTKVQLLESELVYMPIRSMSDFMERLKGYTDRTTQIRFMCSEAISLLNNHQVSGKIPGM